MRGFLRRAATRIGSVLLVAQILLPLLSSAHHHRADEAQAPESCPVCMVKADSPAVLAPPVPQLAPALYSFALAQLSTVAPGFTHRPFRASRAPPLFTPIHRA
jgi:hypothetical protein